MKFRYWIVIFLLLGCAGLLWAGAGQKKDGVRQYKAVVEQVYHHDPAAYTQGLFFVGDVLYESLGQYGSSALRKVDLASGRVLQNVTLAPQFFGEGACIHQNRIYQLTWMENVCFVYDPATLQVIGQLYLPTEGWGITSNGEDLIVSDGSAVLYFLDPETFMERRRVNVTNAGRSLPYLNELEYVDGKIWANVYGTEYLVVIDPANGCVTATVDCRNLLPARYAQGVDVLNGIAYDRQQDAIFITGKLWPQLYRISLTEKTR